MILFKTWAKHKVKSYIYCVNQFLPKKRHKNWSQECKQKQSLLFNFCNIFDLLISRTAKITWWSPIFKPNFYIFSYNGQLRKNSKNFMDKFLLYQTSLTLKNCLSYFDKPEEVKQGKERLLRGVFRTLSNIFDGAFLQKYLTACYFRQIYFTQTNWIQRMKTGYSK